MSESESPQLFAARTSIYPRSVKGRFRRLKWAILFLAYGMYFILPWIRWPRIVGPDQAVLFDIVGRKFYLFDLVVYPQDIFWLAGVLMIGAYLMFFVTGLAGRAFCGYFCFQTLWTDIYIKIEHLIQGERPARIRLANQPLNAEKVWKIGATHFLWLLVAVLTGMTFVFYWGDAFELTSQFVSGEAPFAAYMTALFLMATTYVMAGIAREQVCTYMCPYSRFQSVMFDKDTLVVSYDEQRGEGEKGRAKLRKGGKTLEERATQGSGDCIDCGYCVQVCPTGIDIRNGLQIQCISCALCIDACDTIMDSMEWPRGLISYTSERSLETGKEAKLMRPKVIGYFSVLIAATALLVWSVSNQAPFDFNIAQIRQPIYVQLSDGRIQNSYEIKLNNKTNKPLRLHFEIHGLLDAVLDMGNFTDVVLQPEQRLRLSAKVSVFPGYYDGKSHVFHIEAQPQNNPDLPNFDQPAVFFIPKK